MASILVVDDEPGIREFLYDTLTGEGHEVLACDNGQDAVVQVSARHFDVVLTDLKMPGIGGMEVLRTIKQEQPEVQVIMLTAHGSVENAVEAMKLGAYDYLNKPISSPDELAVLVERAVEKKALIDSQERMAARDENHTPLGYGSAKMAQVEQAIAKVADTPATVLLLGESGVGKEVAAQAIHSASSRADKPFTAINCAALSENLLESELFGHEKGAFTGADQRRRGKVELTDGGTFFLDEVGELRLDLQAKLLRVLQERKFERIGGSQTIEVNVRWIAATNRDLPKMIAEGMFREDLYHRLAVFPIRIPPLRERPEDILPLTARLLADVCRNLHKERLTLSNEAEARLAAWHWPGNVRELRNVLERAAILAEGLIIKAEHLWLEGSSSEGGLDCEIRTLAELENRAIERALAQTDGNRKQAAKLLGIGERTLYDKLKKLNLTRASSAQSE